MLKQLDIENYQSHKQTTLKFHKRLNVIVGKTDSGKTAVIRALRWVLQNRPLGTSFRSKWGGDTKVSCKFNDGTVTRFKSDNNDYYELTLPDEKKLEFRALNKDVPAEIVQFLNMKEVNLQRQFDQPFLLSNTPGQIAAYFNRIAGIDVIDIAAKNARKEITELNQVIRGQKEDIKNKIERLNSFNFIETAEEELKDLEEKQKELDKKEQNIELIKNIIEKIETITIEIDTHKHIIAQESIINSLLEKIKQRKELRGNIESLNSLLSKLAKINEKLQKLNKTLQAEQTITTILQKSAQKTAMKTQISQFFGLLGKYTTLERGIKETSEKVVHLTHTFDNNMPDTCPLCGTKIK